MLRSARAWRWLTAGLLVAVPGEGGAPALRPPTSLVAVVRAGDGMLFSRFVCAGVVVGTQSVATAAHCLDAVPPGARLEVVHPPGGDLCRSTAPQGRPVAGVVSIDEDVAVLSATGDLGDVAQLGASPSPSRASGALVAWGWGGLLGRVCVARPVPLRRLDAGHCTPLAIAADALCATGAGHENTCRGDSGGPVMSAGVVVALTSRGLGCLAGAPGVYEVIPGPTTVSHPQGRVATWN